MALQRSEDHHHSPEQVNGYIEQAIVLLDAHNLTPDERANLLPHVVNLLGAKQLFYEQVAGLPDLAKLNARH